MAKTLIFRTALMITLTFLLSALIIGNVVSQSQPHCDSGPGNVLVLAREAYAQADIDRTFLLSGQALDLCAGDAQRLTEAETFADLLNDLGTAFSLTLSGQFEQAISEYRSVAEQAQAAGEIEIEADVNLLLGQALYFKHDLKNDFSDIITAYGTGIILWRQVGSTLGESTGLGYLATLYEDLYRYEDAITVYEQSYDLSKSIGDEPGQALAKIGIGASQFYLSQYADAKVSLDEALQLWMRLNNPSGIARTRMELGRVLASQGDYAAARMEFEQALELVGGDPYLRSGVLHNLGVISAKQSQFDEAITHLEEALVLRQHQQDTKGIATTQSALGEVYIELSRYDEADQHLTMALELREQSGDVVGMAATRNNIALMYQAQGNYADAEALYQLTLSDLPEGLAPLYKGTALNGLGGVFAIRGQYEMAIDYHSQALAIFEVIQYVDGIATVYNNLAFIDMSRGDLSKALDDYRSAQRIWQDTGNIAAHTTSAINIGDVYHQQGRYADALSIFEDALTTANALNLTALTANIHNAISASYSQRGDYGLAQLHLSVALEQSQAIGDRLTEATALSNIGHLYYRQGRYRLADEQYTSALEIVREIGARFIEVRLLNDQGASYLEASMAGQGSFVDVARQLYDQALVLAEDLGTQIQIGLIKSNLALTYFLEEDYDTARQLTNEALPIFERAGVPSLTATAQLILGGIALEQGDLESSYQYADTARAAFDTNYERPLLTLSLVNLGMVSEVNADYVAAIDYYNQAITVLESILNDTALDNAIANLTTLGKNTWPYQRLATLLARSGDLETGFRSAERGASLLVRLQLSTELIDYSETLDPELIAQERQLRESVNEHQRVLDATNSDFQAGRATSADVQHASRDLDAARELYISHLEHLQLTGGFLERELSGEIATLPQVQSLLPPDTTLLYYSIGTLDSGVFIISDTDARYVPLQTTLDDVNDLLTDFSDDRMGDNGALNTMYQHLFAAVEPELADTDLIIMPGASMRYMPFAALQRDDRSYLVDDYTISYTFNATSLVRQLQDGVPVSSSDVLVMSQSEVEGLERLNYADEEAQEVAAIYDVDAILNATESDLRAQFAQSSVVHIAAHASMEPSAPLFSAIRLGESDAYDGRFELREVFELGMNTSVDLVVLSACETALGNGTDFSLLTYSFAAIGVDRTVASLWNVNDESTAYLMEEYMRLRHDEHLPDAIALQRAMLYTRATHPEPELWAAFVLTGLP